MQGGADTRTNSVMQIETATETRTAKSYTGVKGEGHGMAAHLSFSPKLTKSLVHSTPFYPFSEQ